MPALAVMSAKLTGADGGAAAAAMLSTNASNAAPVKPCWRTIFMESEQDIIREAKNPDLRPCDRQQDLPVDGGRTAEYAHQPMKKIVTLMVVLAIALTVPIAAQSVSQQND